MGVDSNIKARASVAGGHARIKSFLLLSLFAAFFVVPEQFAWSLENSNLDKSVHQLQMKFSLHNNQVSSLPSAMVDRCLPLLQSIRQTNALSAMDRNQRAVGKLTALSLVLGMRYALSPASKNDDGAEYRIGLRRPLQGFAGDQHALAVVQYRACQKEQALRSSLGFGQEIG